MLRNFVCDFMGIALDELQFKRILLNLRIVELRYSYAELLTVMNSNVELQLERVRGVLKLEIHLLSSTSVKMYVMIKTIRLRS